MSNTPEAKIDPSRNTFPSSITKDKESVRSIQVETGRKGVNSGSTQYSSTLQRMIKQRELADSKNVNQEQRLTEPYSNSPRFHERQDLQMKVEEAQNAYVDVSMDNIEIRDLKQSFKNEKKKKR